MRRTFLAVIIMSTLAAGGMALAQHGGHGKDGVQVKLLSQKDIIEKLDGKKAKATMVSARHRQDQPGQRGGLAPPRSCGRRRQRERANRGELRFGRAISGRHA